jgi:hypothetical protein
VLLLYQRLKSIADLADLVAEAQQRVESEAREGTKLYA